MTRKEEEEEEEEIIQEAEMPDDIEFSAIHQVKNEPMVERKDDRYANAKQVRKDKKQEMEVVREKQIAFLKAWAGEPDNPMHVIANEVEVSMDQARKWIDWFQTIRLTSRDVYKSFINYSSRAAPNRPEIHLDRKDIDALIPVAERNASDTVGRAYRQKVEAGQIKQAPAAHDSRQPMLDPNIAGDHAFVQPASYNYQNPQNSTVSEPQMQEQYDFPELSLLQQILRDYGVKPGSIPGVINNYARNRLIYLQQPQRMSDAFRAMLGPVVSGGVYNSFVDGLSLHNHDVLARFPALAQTNPSAGLFPSQATINASQQMPNGQQGGLMTSPQWAGQQMNPQMWQYVAQGMPPPPVGGSMADYYVWQKMFDSWNEDQRFKQQQQRNVSNLMGNLGQGGQHGGMGQDFMSQFAPIMQALRPDIIMQRIVDNNGNISWQASNNPAYQGNFMGGKNQDPNAEMTKEVMRTLATIASSAIQAQPKTDPSNTLLNSILPPLINKTIQPAENQIAAIQKMLEVANTLQKPQIQETPEIAMAKIDTKMAMWREELEWRRTVHDWDVQDKRERQSKEQQDSFLNLFKEAGKDVLPTFLKMFGPMAMSMVMPKGASPEQMAMAAMQRFGGPQAQGMVIPPQQMQQQQQEFNPFQGQPQPPQMYQSQPPQQQQFNPFQVPIVQPQTQAQMYQQQQPQQQYEEETAPGPEDFTGLSPDQIDRLLDVTRDRQARLEQYANAARIAKTRMRMMSQPPPIQQSTPFMHMQQQQQQPFANDNINPEEFEFMPANTMTEAEESNRGGITGNDMRNEIQMQNFPESPEMVQPEGSGYESVNTQGMEQYDTGRAAQPQQQQSAGTDFGEEVAASNMPEINEPLDIQPGTAINANQQPTRQQSGERVIKRPSRRQ